MPIYDSRTPYNDTYVNASPKKTVSVTPSDTTTYNPPLMGFRVGTAAGDVAVVDGYGNTVVIPSVQVGETIAGEYSKIRATSTTATGITGWSR